MSEIQPATPIQLGALLIRSFPNMIGLIVCIYLIWGAQQSCEVQRIELTHQLTTMQTQFNSLR